jgi:hypothetical protein
MNEVRLDKGGRGDSGTLVDRLACRLCNLNRRHIIDVRAG